MLQLFIEGLKPDYETLSNAIKRANLNEEEQEEAFGALDALIQKQLCITTSYEGMKIPQMMLEIEQDMRFIRGEMTPEEEEKHISHHWDLAEQHDKKHEPNEQRDKAIALVNAYFDESKTILVKDDKHGVKDWVSIHDPNYWTYIEKFIEYVDCYRIIDK